MKIVNLAKRPFVNLRPMKRVSLLLWIAGILLLATNLYLYWDHLTGSSAARTEIEEVQAGIREENDQLDELDAEVADLELDEQNETVTILNDLIEERVFPWGPLFDRLENVLPDQVRLSSVRPESQASQSAERSRRRSGSRRGSRSRAAGEDPDRPVNLALSGVARDEDALLDLVDRLYDDPAFRNPTLRGETRTTRNEIDFAIDVEFLTRVAASGDDTEAEVDSAIEVADGEETPGDPTGVPVSDPEDDETTATIAGAMTPVEGAVDLQSGETDTTSLQPTDTPANEGRDSRAADTIPRSTRPIEPDSSTDTSSRTRTAQAPPPSPRRQRVPVSRGTLVERDDEDDPSTAADPPQGNANPVPGFVVLPSAPQQAQSPTQAPAQQPAAQPETTLVDAASTPTRRPRPQSPSQADTTAPPSSPPRTQPAPPPPPAPGATSRDPAPVSTNASSAARLGGGGRS